MFTEIDAMIATERRKDILKQAERARLIRKSDVSMDYLDLLKREARASINHAGRLVRVLVQLMVSLVISPQRTARSE